jgi:hypothetical protein
MLLHTSPQVHQPVHHATGYLAHVQQVRISSMVQTKHLVAWSRPCPWLLLGCFHTVALQTPDLAKLA